MKRRRGEKFVITARQITCHRSPRSTRLPNHFAQLSPLRRSPTTKTKILSIHKSTTQTLPTIYPSIPNYQCEQPMVHKTRRIYPKLSKFLPFNLWRKEGGRKGKEIEKRQHTQLRRTGRRRYNNFIMTRVITFRRRWPTLTFFIVILVFKMQPIFILFDSHTKALKLFSEHLRVTQHSVETIAIT